MSVASIMSGILTGAGLLFGGNQHVSQSLVSPSSMTSSNAVPVPFTPHDSHSALSASHSISLHTPSVLNTNPVLNSNHQQPQYIKLNEHDLPPVPKKSSPVNLAELCKDGKSIDNDLSGLESVSICITPFFQNTFKIMTIHHALLRETPAAAPVRVVVRAHHQHAPWMETQEYESGFARDMEDSPFFVKFYGSPDMYNTQKEWSRRTAMGIFPMGVYEFIEGKTLWDYTAEGSPSLIDKAVAEVQGEGGTGTRALDEIACFTDQLLKARHHMFKKGWYHLDLHFNNVMTSATETYEFTPEIKCPLIKVLDFDYVDKYARQASSVMSPVLRGLGIPAVTGRRELTRAELTETLLLHSHRDSKGALFMYNQIRSKLPETNQDAVKVHPKVLATLKEVFEDVNRQYKLNLPRDLKQSLDMQPPQVINMLGLK